jgi:hypothetical protein
VSRVQTSGRTVPAVLPVGGVTGLVGLAAALAWAAAGEVLRLGRQRGDLAFDDLVLCCALLVLAAMCGWLGVAVLLTLLTHGLRCTHSVAGRLARWITPSLARRLVAGACGAAVLATPAVTVSAAAAPGDPAPARSTRHSADTASTRTGALPVPDRPTRVGSSAGRPGDDLARSPGRVRVRPGDSLWEIAAGRLPLDATDAAVAASWPRWFRHNRRLIGPDPDLIHPGTCLRIPPRPRRPLEGPHP